MITLPQQIIQTLRDAFSSAFVQYYDGDPIAIPRSALPCIVVELERTEVAAGPTGMDRLTHTVSVSLVLDKAADFGQSSEGAVTAQRLQALAAAQNDDRTFDAASVMGVLRTDLTLAGVITSQAVQIEYGVRQRPEQMLTGEARLTFTCGQLVPVTRVPQPS